MPFTKGDVYKKPLDAFSVTIRAAVPLSLPHRVLQRKRSKGRSMAITSLSHAVFLPGRPASDLQPCNVNGARLEIGAFLSQLQLDTSREAMAWIPALWIPHPILAMVRMQQWAFLVLRHSWLH